MISRNLTAPYGLPAAYLHFINQFAEAVEKLGVEACGAEGLSFGRRGLRLSLASGENEYLTTLERDMAKLELIRMDQARVVLSQGGAANQSVWEKFVQIVKQLESK